MTHSPVSVEESLRLLAAAALHSKLRSVLVFDAGPDRIQRVAEALEYLLTAALHPLPVDRITVAPFHGEDDLWGTSNPIEEGIAGESQKRPSLRQGLLYTPDENPFWRIVVLPDLASLSMAAARACVQLMATDIAHLERHGQQSSWQPRIFWLAACESQKIETVSRHLIQRFSIRFQIPKKLPQEGMSLLRQFLEDPERQHLSAEVLAIVRSLAEKVTANRERRPTIPLPILEEIEALLVTKGGSGLRRHLNLSRLSLALAGLDGADHVRSDHIQEAARLLGLPETEDSTGTKAPATSPPPVAARQNPAGRKQAVLTPSPERKQPAGGTGEILIDPLSDTSKNDDSSLESTASSEGLDMFPEERSSSQWIQRGLQIPLSWSDDSARAQGRGSIVGIRRTTRAEDLAILATVIAASPFQRKRRGRSPHSQTHFILRKEDLRSWVRRPPQPRLIVIVADLTAWTSAHLSSALAPYIQKAYEDRAQACAITVGADSALNELRADHLTVRNVLVPEFRIALSRAPGRATPLADGLHLAYTNIQKLRHRGRLPRPRVTLVIASDGRGNVPLRASHGEPMRFPVSREGIADAQQAASELAALEGVEIILLDPSPTHLQELVNSIAASLGIRSTPSPPVAFTPEDR
jgi:magnesium chelatase subunit D